MTKFNTLADCAAEFPSTNQGATYGRFADNLRNNTVDLIALSNIEREARRQVAACEAIRSILKAERDKVFDASNAALDARKAKRGK